MKCRCGCDIEYTPSRSTLWKLRRGEDVGYLRGHKRRGVNNPRWRGGRPLLAHGYRMVLRPDHPNAMKNGYVLEHRLVISEHLGRPLRDDEVVHHKNGDRADNRVENLELMSETTHKRLHFSGERNSRWKPAPRKLCAGCGTPFEKSGPQKHDKTQYCSRKCMQVTRRGERAAHVKLSDADVAAIRALKGLLPQRTIAARFGVGKTQIARIHHGTSR